MKLAPLWLLALAAPGVFCLRQAPEPAVAADPAAEAEREADPIWANAACYVCHTPFVREELSKVHVEGKVTCVKCHGLSADHANDENIGATPPDIVFPRDEIDPLCLRCHPTHNVPAQEVVLRFLERRLPATRPPVCTDCHGRHKIERLADE